MPNQNGANRDYEPEPWRDDDDPDWRDIIEGLETRVREGIQLRWQELRAVETIWEEIATEFDGEHPARPLSLDSVEQMKKRLRELREQVQTTTGPLELPEPKERQVELVRETVRRATGSLVKTLAPAEGCSGSPSPTVLRIRERVILLYEAHRLGLVPATGFHTCGK